MPGRGPTGEVDAHDARSGAHERDQGGRATFPNTLGVGVSWYWEETRYTPFATPHGASGADAWFGTVNTGLVVGIGSTATALSSFGSGRR